MRLTGTVACFLVAWNCAEMAMGSVSQELFAPKNIWVWWIFAFMWAVSCLQFIFAGE